jgi:ribose 5-phosphate isomerase A
VALLSGPECVKDRLTGALPVVIEGENWEDTAEELDDMFLSDAEVSEG